MDLEESLHPDRISELIDYDFPYTVPYIVGSCRGFLLIGYDRGRSLSIWNPSTHVHKPLPVDANAYEYDHMYPYEYGFGYDSSKDDYLVVRVPGVKPGSSTNFADVQFFSLRANIWKYTESVDLPSSLASTKGADLPTFTTVPDHSVGLLFNEAIHWVAQNFVAGRVTHFIIAFDLMEKRLLEIPQPQPVDLFPQGFGFYILWVHGRFFSLTAFQGDTIEIWVMKKYKVQSSWTKTFVLSSKPLFPLCSTKGGDLVIECGENLTKYSDEGLQGDQLENFNQFGLVDSSVPLYTESMLSLPDVSG
ncbi:F-box/kelch-repeat protein At3g06240-like [Lotus japonicus]|uniref:F-box/kelch-repeat protein At3g06240-like n=1 Tax=Lotus japonicus TaxID=34305 RepID=UPI0025829239|nr:F-box/kelch-repeat protein At3g06240-like [Lotus japonicus]